MSPARRASTHLQPAACQPHSQAAGMEERGLEEVGRAEGRSGVGLAAVVFGPR